MRAGTADPRAKVGHDGIGVRDREPEGGVGKTTTAVNLAACIAASGRQVLLVDLDPQCNATVALGLDRDATLLL